MIYILSRSLANNSIQTEGTQYLASIESMPHHHIQRTRHVTSSYTQSCQQQHPNGGRAVLGVVSVPQNYSIHIAELYISVHHLYSIHTAVSYFKKAVSNIYYPAVLPTTASKRRARSTWRRVCAPTRLSSRSISRPTGCRTKAFSCSGLFFSFLSSFLLTRLSSSFLSCFFLTLLSFCFVFFFSDSSLLCLICQQ